MTQTPDQFPAHDDSYHEISPMLHHGPEEDDDASDEAFLHRMQEVYASQRTPLDDLREVFENEGAGEHFQTLLDDLTFDALQDLPEFHENAAKVKDRSLPKTVQTEYRDKQRALFAQMRHEIIEEAGLPTGIGASEIESAKRRVENILRDSLKDASEFNPQRALGALGILKQDDEGGHYFTYPMGLFPENVDHKWEIYLQAVRNHLRIERNFEAGISVGQELEDADRARRLAHNAVARNVDEILGLSATFPTTWDLEKSRNLIAKMRDTRYPTVETAEADVTAEAIVGAVLGVHAVKALSRRQRLSEFHKK